MGFFDIENRYAALDAKNDLVKVNAAVPWEAFRSRLERVWRKQPTSASPMRGASRGDAPCSSHHFVRPLQSVGRPGRVSDADRLSFVRFLGLTLEDKVPDAKTVWLYREQLSQAASSPCSRISTAT